MIETIKEEYRKSRKAHLCNYCGEKINKGQIYRYLVLKFDGRIYEHKAHKECIDVDVEEWMMEILWRQ